MKQNRMRDHVHRVHFIGIGGVGMGGIAEILLQEGYQISGSDVENNAMCQRLASLGAIIYIGQRAENVIGADVVVVSSAIAKNNPEYYAAITSRIPIVPRAQMLSELMRFRYGVAVAGTHGKTTTTSLIASILAQGNLSPTFVIGGQLTSCGSNAKLGESKYLVVEADESDASFLHLKPMMSVVTNIDADHMQTYAGNFDSLRQTFINFLHNLPFYGLAVVCADDPNIQMIISSIARPIVTYGFSKSADLQICDPKQQGLTGYFTVKRKSQEDLAVVLNMPGIHNMLNATAAIAIAQELGVNDNDILTALRNFAGVGRRLQVYHQLMFANKPFTLIDDYGHHPTEIKVTLSAIANAYPKQRLVMVFQPHRYSRTNDLYHDFCEVLATVDELILLEIYSAGEEPIADITSASLANTIASNSQLKPIVVADYQALQTVLADQLKPNDLLLMQGAGSIGRMVKQLLATCNSNIAFEK